MRRLIEILRAIVASEKPRRESMTSTKEPGGNKPSTTPKKPRKKREAKPQRGQHPDAAEAKQRIHKPQS